ncbi:hypothetical protein EYF80_029928 [Liparis tanakae]|uniref:Secreted protein n=1 Tax=Liparis tanakae TaxID=230148 RepID=A0A4Z2H281_9TELE|nr:hypothetical protein EYF80_029928 [Liparis tanakae]
MWWVLAHSSKVVGTLSFLETTLLGLPRTHAAPVPGAMAAQGRRTAVLIASVPPRNNSDPSVTSLWILIRSSPDSLPLTMSSWVVNRKGEPKYRRHFLTDNSNFHGQKKGQSIVA